MLAYFAIIPVLIAVLLYIVHFEKAARLIAIAAQTVLAGFAFYVFIRCKDGDIITRVGNYDGFMGIILKADVLSSVFVMLVSLIFFMITIYSFNDKINNLFWFFLFVWQGLLYSIFLSCDLFNIFVLIEVSTVLVSVLIMFNRSTRLMYDGMVYLMVNVVATQFYLFGMGYIYKLFGVFDINAIAKAILILDDRKSLILPYALLMTTVCFKCALVPMFGWLPKAYRVPGTPDSVMALMSGLHIKSGVFLFIRLHTMFRTITIPEFYLVIGIITAILGCVFALLQSDIKLMLAYSTVSKIGVIIVALNLDNPYSYTGGIYHVINHAVFKTALFLSAGMIYEAYGTRDVNKIRGVIREYPVLGVSTLLAVLGIVDAPLFNGSISKYFIVAGAGDLVNALLMLVNLGTILVFIKYSAMLFGYPLQDHSHNKPDVYKQAVVLFMGILCFCGGVYGKACVAFLFNIKVSIDIAGYMNKAFWFAVTGTAAYFIYKKVLPAFPEFEKMREKDLSFQWICAAQGVFFGLVIIVQWLYGTFSAISIQK